VVFLDLSRANFSVSRMAALQALNTARPQRDYFNTLFNQPLFEWWVSGAILDGRLKLRDEPATYDVNWLPPKWDMIDPKVEAETAKLMIEQNLLTYQEFHQARGQSYVDVFTQRAEEKKLADKLGVAPVLMPGAVPAAAPEPAKTDEQ
jgi:capsid protein